MRRSAAASAAALYRARGEPQIADRMPHSLGHATRTPRMSLVRRLIAAMLLVCASVTLVEPVFADSCDGDYATRPASAASMHADGGATIPSHDGIPGHAVHVCHCSHVHGVVVRAAQSALQPMSLVDVARVLVDVELPPSISQEPQLRPPRPRRIARAS